MKKTTLILLFIFFVCKILNAQTKDFYSKYFSKSNANCKQLVYTNFIVEFDTLKCAPLYTIYLITKEELKNKIVKRKVSFNNDKRIDCVKAKDYQNSGYDKGHLTPAEDMSYSKESMNDCFYITNITPQIPSFNRGVWKSLESKIRNWTLQYDSLIIITGTINVDTNNALNVPKKMYKIIYSVKYKKGIAFIFENKFYNRKEDVFKYESSVGFVEKEAKLEFFYGINVDFKKIFDAEFWK
jgi:endonuclease G